MEIPTQYKATMEFGILKQAKVEQVFTQGHCQFGTCTEIGKLFCSRRTRRVRKGLVRPPPPGVPNASRTIQVLHATSSTTEETDARSTVDVLSESQVCARCLKYGKVCKRAKGCVILLMVYFAVQLCPVCLQEAKDMAFQCGHQVQYILHLMCVCVRYDMI